MDDELTKVLFDKINSYIKNPREIERIKKAYEMAKRSHEGQFRRSKEPYIIHPVKVAEILAEYHTGPDTIISGLLHDVVEDTPTTLEEVRDEFGDMVALIVDGVTKIGQYKFKSRAKQIAETHQKLLIATSKDIRVIIVKLADRLHNMRTIQYVPDIKKTRICRETLEVYAPIAHRLGMYRIKAELEDLSFKYLEPNAYNSVAKMIQETKEMRNKNLDKVIAGVKEELDKKGIEYTIKGRIKNIYSIYKKMKTKNKEFDEIYDLLALRVIVNTVAECYQILGIIHSKYKPLPNRFKDYIAIPKVNMYQSLHTTIITKEGIFEVQIRTKDMDDVAEFGIAAHWAYKEGKAVSQEREEIRNTLHWYNRVIELSEHQQHDNLATEEFLGNVYEDLQSNVFIFTPTGDVFMFPQGSTPIDFAYRIHSEIGDTCVGAVVNHKMVPLDYVLKSNDIVEIKTSKNAKGPNEDWLKIAKTSAARSKIKSYLNRQNHDLLVSDGKKKFEDVVKEVGKLDNFNDEFVKDKFKIPEIQNIDDMYYSIGKNTISARSAYNKLIGNKNISEEEIIEAIKAKKTVNSNNVYGIIVEGLDNPLIKLSNCCNPIPGDKIVGYVTKGLGLSIHRVDCPNLKNTEKSRLLNVSWSTNNNKIKYAVNLKITAFQNNNILQEVISILAANNSSITKYHSIAHDNDTTESKITINTYNLDTLKKIISNIKKVKNVIKVERVFK